LFERGELVLPDRAKAEVYLKKACTLGVAIACR